MMKKQLKLIMRTMKKLVLENGGIDDCILP